ncbi:MAG: response regulator, partial [Desulfovibrio sp.]|nr:response regulator [Desulfovibrio sp.]
MTHGTAKKNMRTATSTELAFVLSAAAGLAAALLVFAGLHFSSSFERGQRLRAECLHSLYVVRANLDSLWGTALTFAEHASRQMNPARETRLYDLASQYRSLWPEVSISLYGATGELLPPEAFASSALHDFDPGAPPVPSTVRSLVHKALMGMSARDVTRSRGFVSLSAAVPMRGKNARVLVLTLPLDGLTLEKVRERSQADVAIVPLDDFGKRTPDDFGGAVSTFGKSGAWGDALWNDLEPAVEGRVFSADETVLLDSGGVAASTMTSASGMGMGLLFAAPPQAGIAGFALRHASMALLVGFVIHGFVFFCLNRYARHLGSAFSDAVRVLTDSGETSGEAQQARWPAPFQAALGRVSRSIREYQKRTRALELERDALGRQCREPGEQPVRKQGGDDDYQRLFDNAPVGIFQVDADGAFLRVNQFFSLMLGYDTPVQLLSENISFTNFCLYGDEIRNPIGVLLEQGGGRQILSLRRRDGGIGSFSLFCTPLTRPDGSLSTIVECFLFDLGLAEQAARAEREKDFADRRRASLALLLAATCRQTQTHLVEPYMDRRGQSRRASDAGVPAPPAVPDSAVGLVGGAAAAVEPEGPDLPALSQERRQSVLSVKAVLGDIYQIAMTEATASAPVDVPIDFSRFLQRLCRQSLPSMHLRGISMRCEVVGEFLTRLSGPAPLLRHALQRALLAVTAPVRGGWATLSVVRDPNAPKSPGLSRVLFSASWSSVEREAGKQGFLSAEDGFSLGEGGLTQVFDAPDDPSGIEPASVEAASGTLGISDEQEVIRYLAQRMRGDFLESVFTDDVRSMQIVVPMNHVDSLGDIDQADSFAVSAPGADFGAPGAFDPVGALTAFAPRHREAGHDAAERAMAGHRAAPLNILVSDDADEAAYEGRDASSGLNILLVDDSLNNRLLFSIFLRDTRHRITEAHDGQEGVEAFQHGQFDVIFMDMEMPLMDGYQATRIIRALEADNNREPTPIVGMTSYALPEFRRQCMLSGCSDFLSKPVSKIALFAIL